MRGTIGTVLFATAALAGAATASPARAEVMASEVLGWCDGASQPGQLGTINALRCVNYLQGAAEMVQALSGTDFGGCLEGSQSVGTQLLARFVPQLRARATTGPAEPVAGQIADWLAAECAVELSVVASAEGSGAGDGASTAAVEQQLQAALAALDEAQLAARASADEALGLRSALARANAGRDGALQACTTSLDRMSDDLAAAESAASENGMRVTELELELEAVDAEALARRQEITAAADRLAALSTQFDAALAAKRREIEDAERRIAALTENLDAALNQRADAELALSEARAEARLAEQHAAEADAGGVATRLEAAESELDLSRDRIAALEGALQTSRDNARRLEDDLRTTLQGNVEHAALISALEGDLAACDIAMIRAETPAVPPPAPTPHREPAPASVAVAPLPPSPPAPMLNRVDVPAAARSGGNIANGNARIPGSGGASIAIASQARPLDTLGLMALRQTQQLALHENDVGQRRQWASLNGDFTGYVEVLREGYAGPDFCREVFSVAQNGGAEVHRSAEMFCRAGDLWLFRR